MLSGRYDPFALDRSSEGYCFSFFELLLNVVTYDTGVEYVLVSLSCYNGEIKPVNGIYYGFSFFELLQARQGRILCRIRCVLVSLSCYRRIPKWQKELVEKF